MTWEKVPARQKQHKRYTFTGSTQPAPSWCPLSLAPHHTHSQSLGIGAVKEKHAHTAVFHPHWWFHPHLTNEHSRGVRPRAIWSPVSMSVR